MGKSSNAFGFLTVVEHPQHGVFGGFLVLNEAGRPLEFHCTTPVKPSRAQEILYGATLRPYLFGEQIGHALYSKSRERPTIVCTDQRAVLAMRSRISGVPVAFVLPCDQIEEIDPEAASARNPFADADADDQTTWEIEPSSDGSERLIGFRLGVNRLAVSAADPSDRDIISEQMRKMAAMIDLNEPFTRIREAINEAKRAG